MTTPTFNTHTANTPRNPTEVPNWDVGNATVDADIAGFTPPLDFLFLGDSITSNFKRTDGAAVWNGFYGSRKVLNYGIGGEITEGLLYRLIDLDQMGAFTPRLAILCVGTNNTIIRAPNPVTALQALDGILANIATIRTKSPTTKVLVLTQLPRDTPGSATRILIDQINALLAIEPYIDGTNVMLLDMGTLFKNPGTQDINTTLISDGVHPNTNGYVVFANAIEPYIRAVEGEGFMSFVAAKATGQTGTAAATTQIPIALDLGGEVPKAFWVRMFGRTELTDTAAAADLLVSIGFGVSGSERACVQIESTNAAATTATARRSRSDCILQRSTGRLDVHSVAPDLLTLVVDVQFATSWAFEVDAIGGSAVTAASVVSWAPGTATGSFPVTGVGHGGRYIEHMSAFIGDNTANNPLQIGIGKACIPGNQQQCLSGWSSHAAAAAITSRYATDAQGFGIFTTSAAISGRFDTTTSDADGFTVNIIEALGSGRSMYSLVIDGTFQCALGSGLTEDDTSTLIPIAGSPTFQPVLTQIMTHGTTESTVDTAQTGFALSMGSVVGHDGDRTYEQTCASVIDVHTADPTVCGAAVDYDSVIVNLSTVAAVQGEVEVMPPAIGSETGLDLINADADPTPVFFLFAMFGDAIATGGGAAGMLESGWCANC